jgi:hypothetical protein
VLHDQLAPEHLLLVELQWHSKRVEYAQELMRLGVPKERWPQSIHWNWAGKAHDLRLLEAAGYAVEGEGVWQGAMLTKSATHLSAHRETRGKPLIYVDYLEVAPWNWTIQDLGQLPKFKAIGPTLLREAVLQSIGEEFEGRVGLHALRQAEQFYGRCGMEAMGRDATKQDLMYFELTTDGAQRFLNGG